MFSTAIVQYKNIKWLYDTNKKSLRGILYLTLNYQEYREQIYKIPMTNKE